MEYPSIRTLSLLMAQNKVGRVGGCDLWRKLPCSQVWSRQAGFPAAFAVSLAAGSSLRASVGTALSSLRGENGVCSFQDAVMLSSRNWVYHLEYLGMLTLKTPKNQNSIIHNAPGIPPKFAHATFFFYKEKNMNNIKTNRAKKKWKYVFKKTLRNVLEPV